MRVKLEELVEEVSERTTINNQHPVLTSSRSGIYLQEDYFKKQVASKDNTGYRVIRKGEFTYRAMSDTGEFYPNKLECTDIGIVSPAYPVFKIKDYRILPDYLKYYFKSRSFQKSITAFVQGSTRASMKFGKMKSISIDLPDEDKQNQILNTIGILENIIDKYELEIDHLNNLIKARFVEMFGDLDLAPQNKEWTKISDIGEVVSGSTPKTSIKEYWNGNICWITPAELSNMSGIIYDSKKKITERGKSSCSLRMMPSRTVILSSRAPIGKVALLGKEMCCNQGFKNIICNEKVAPEYLYYLLGYNTIFLNSLGRGATFKEISKKIVGEIKVPLPAKELQNQFAVFTRQVDKSKFVLSNELTMCDFYIRLIHDRVMHSRINLRVAQ